MRHFWLNGITTLSLGLACCQHASAQYPVYNYNTGPSSYSVQLPNPQYQRPASSFYLTGAQDSPNVSEQVHREPVTPGSVHGTPHVAPQQPLQSVQQPFAPGSVVYGESVGPNYEGHAYQAVPGHSSQAYPVPHQAYPAQSPAYAAQAQGYGYQPGIVGAPGCGPSAGGLSCGQPSCNSCGPTGSFSVAGPWSGWPAGRLSGALFGAGACGPTACGVAPVQKPWFFGGGVLLFQRIDNYNRLLTVDDGGMPLLYSEDARSGVIPGFEVFGGRYFNCGKNAISIGYWGLFPGQEMTSVYDSGAGIRSWMFGTGEFMYPDAMPGDVYEYYDDASYHRLRRSSEFHNIEVNLLGFAVGGAARNFNLPVQGCAPQGCATDSCGQASGPSRLATGPCGYLPPQCGSRLNFSWLAGFRWFHFGDNFEYAAIDTMPMPEESLSYDVNTTNNLVGFQIGNRADFCIGSCVNLYALSRVGIYNNHANLRTRLFNEDGYAYETGMPSTVYNVSRSTDQVAFIGELGAGLGWRISSKWSATAGYRAIFASGVATSTGNLRYQSLTIDRINIHARDSLVLHGVNIGAVYNF